MLWEMYDVVSGTETYEKSLPEGMTLDSDNVRDEEHLLLLRRVWPWTWVRSSTSSMLKDTFEVVTLTSYPLPVSWPWPLTTYPLPVSWPWPLTTYPLPVSWPWPLTPYPLPVYDVTSGCTYVPNKGRMSLSILLFTYKDSLHTKSWFLK